MREGKKLIMHGIIGVCGHVDHGKTALIKALTGFDTDRLKEEKIRGISIEAGFAYLEAPDGERLGVIDAPGHERFVGNMLAAASGIDLALLVVAADEGVMPQTREHLDILRILRVKRGVIAVTKLDLADEKMLADTHKQIEELIAETFLNETLIINVSAKTREGLETLRAALFKAAFEIPRKLSDGSFRLPIDRVFTVQGFGTVVTGTLMDAELDISSAKAMIYPKMLPVRLRGLQIHSRQAEKAQPGERAAVNLALKKDDASRGDVLAEKGSLVPSMMLDTELELLDTSSYTVRNNSRVHLYIGGKHLIAKVILLEADELCAGGSGFAQLRLTSPVAVKKSDRFVIRFYSPEITIGGGEVLDSNPLKRRRFRPEVIDRLQKLKQGLPVDKDASDVLAGVAGGADASSLRKHPAGEEIERIYLDFGMNPPAASIAAANIDAALFWKTLALLVREKRLIRLDDATYIHNLCYDEAVSLYKQLDSAGGVTLGSYRDALKTSRRVAFALFVHFETHGIKRPEH